MPLAFLGLLGRLGPGRLVGEVYAQAELEAAGIQGIVGEGEVVFAEPSLVDVAPEHVETAFVELGREVDVAEWIVAYFYFVLGVEGHCGRLVGQSVVAGVIVAVYTYLHLHHLECPEIKEHVGVYGQSRQRDDVLLR